MASNPMAPNFIKAKTMKLEYAKNPQWVDAEHTMIDLVIKWDVFPEELPFTASPNDIEQHGRDIFAAALQGEFGPVVEYVPPPMPEAPVTQMTAM